MSLPDYLDQLIEREMTLAGSDGYRQARQEAQKVLDLLGYGQGDRDEHGDLIADNVKTLLSLVLARIPGGSANLRMWLEEVRDSGHRDTGGIWPMP